ncbi:MAG: membrane protein insertion efficiency factor YidD [Spirosomataceae bacterium]
MKQISKAIGFVLILFVRLYQVAISPYFPNACRHSPTCSQYMIESIQEWGFLKGTWLGLVRLSKCHPWGTHGFDPVKKRGAEPKK